MTTRFIEWPVMQWAIVLGLGFPLLMLALGELAYRSRKNPGVASTLKNLRNLVLPTLAIWLVLREVVQLPADHRAIKFSETAFWIALIYSALTFVNEVIFASASAESVASRVPKLLLDLLRLILVVLGGSIVLSKVWGMDLTSLATALGVGSIVIGLALQEPLGNVFAGLMLLFEHPVSVGDWIEVEGKIGKVMEINWRSVHILTFTQEFLIVPNSILNKGSFRNLSRPTSLRIEEIRLGFSYDDPPNKVKQILMEVIKDTPDILTTPTPVIRTLDYADFAIIYLVRLPIPSVDDLGRVRDAFMTRVWYAAQRHGLTIPFPIRTVHNSSQQEVNERTAPRPAALLGQFPLWTASSQDTEEVQQEAHNLARQAKYQRYTAGETIIKAGERPNGIQLVVQGLATLLTQDRNGQPTQIAEVGPGEFFGEGSVMAGQTSEFTVIAKADTNVLIIEPDTVNHWITQRPRLGREIGTILDVRRRAAQASRKTGVSVSSVQGNPDQT